MSRPIVSDYKLLVAAGILSIFGIAMVYSAGQTDTPTAVATVYKSQILWLLIGLGFAYAVGHSSVRFIEWMTTPLYLFSIFLLALTLVVGKGAGTAASTKSPMRAPGTEHATCIPRSCAPTTPRTASTDTETTPEATRAQAESCAPTPRRTSRR